MENSLAIYFISSILLITVSGNVLSNVNGNDPTHLRKCNLPYRILKNSIVKLFEEPMIVRRSAATEVRFPYQVVVISSDDNYWYFCSGAILNSNFVITAGHCVEHDLSGIYSLVEIGGVNNGNWSAKSILNVYLHEKYTAGTVNQTPVNDIALIELGYAIEFDDNIKSVPLQSVSTPLGTSCLVSGWRADYQSDVEHFPHVPNTLLYANISVTSCNNPYGSVYDGIICASPGNGGKSNLSQIDTGSPLVCDGLLTGVTSWGRECGEEGTIGYYTDVSYYYEWILKHIPPTTIQPTTQSRSFTTTTPATTTQSGTQSTASSVLILMAAVIIMLHNTNFLMVTGFILE